MTCSSELGGTIYIICSMVVCLIKEQDSTIPDHLQALMRTTVPNLCSLAMPWSLGCSKMLASCSRTELDQSYKKSV